MSGKGLPAPFDSLVVATRNGHKLREFGEAMQGVHLDPLPEGVALPPEDGETFAENALVKARTAATATGRPALADDSGIEAAALGGLPGVRSARYAGEDATDQANLDKLIGALAGEDDRRVAYVCALALVSPDGSEWVVEGRCEGKLVDVPRGSGGFGYDPAFVPSEGDGVRTMAELTPDEKHAISHRGVAIAALQNLLEGEGR
jgi:XTP/dITP diphosphohydrolase